jgi:hypothetical protein
MGELDSSQAENGTLNSRAQEMPVVIRALKQSGALAKCAAINWVSDNASTTGASLAFFAPFQSPLC